MKLRSFAVAVATTAIVAGAVIAPTAAFADSSAFWSQPTLCPGETVTLTVNGISDGQQVTLTAPEYFRQQIGTTPQFLNSSSGTGGFTWDQFSVWQGQTYTLEVITGGDLNDPSVGTVLSTSSVQILTECAAPAPLPDQSSRTRPTPRA